MQAYSLQEDDSVANRDYVLEEINIEQRLIKNWLYVSKIHIKTTYEVIGIDID